MITCVTRYRGEEAIGIATYTVSACVNQVAMGQEKQGRQGRGTPGALPWVLLALWQGHSV